MKNEKKLLTIITPIYNRSNLLVKLYNSLVEQEEYNFVWLVVDDGSQEDVEAVVKKLTINAPFLVKFIKKRNGGKHTALNVAFSSMDTDLAMIVDSDDVLTSNATKLISKKWSLVKNKNVAGMIFLKGYYDGGIVGKSELEDGIYDMIKAMFKYKIGGDKEEIFRCDVLNKYCFPEYEGEKYIGEDYIWRQIYLEYKMAYFNNVIYLCEYLEDGLTKQGRKLRIKCPFGGMDNSKVSFSSKFPIKERIKRGILFVTYGKFANLSFRNIIKKSGCLGLIIICYLPGYFVYKYWEKKYMENS
ncbi:MAG: glycosyltransferase family 2 protein [Lachnospiraceae bacterium]|nr:glycosyltransferase family 2 protein [Lachnospiraceae bacterium]